MDTPNTTAVKSETFAGKPMTVIPDDSLLPVGYTPVGAAKMSVKARTMQEINEAIPTNEYGLPEYMYRADMVPNLSAMTVQTRNEHLEMAILDLDYRQGFPALADGEPFWGQLPCEPDEAYRAFIAYLDTPRAPGQRLGMLHAKNKSKDSGTNRYTHPLGPTNTNQVPVRQLHLLGTIVGKPTSDLMECSYLFYWPQRVRAYDLFTIAIHKKRKEQRLMELEDDHYDMASSFIASARAQLEKMLDEPEECELKPKELIDLLSKMVQLQRISVGASPLGATNGKASGEGTIPQNADLEVIMRTITQNSGVVVNKDTSGDTTKLLLQDPEALHQAQELIIRMGDIAKGRKPGGAKNTNTEAFDD